VRTRWPGTRAFLVTVVLFFWMAEALPLPMLSRRHMNRDMAREEVQRWVAIMSDLGIQTTEKQVVNQTIAISRRSLRFRRRLVAPFRRVERIFGTGQAWGLFTYPDPYPGRLVVEGTSGGNAWTVLYRDPDSDGGYLARTVRYRRIRGIWDDAGDRPKPGKLYNRWVTWLARRVFADHPDLQKVRVRLDRVTVRTPDQPPVTGPDQPRHVREREREGSP